MRPTSDALGSGGCRKLPLDPRVTQRTCTSWKIELGANGFVQDQEMICSRVFRAEAAGRRRVGCLRGRLERRQDWGLRIVIDRQRKNILPDRGLSASTCDPRPHTTQPRTRFDYLLICSMQCKMYDFLASYPDKTVSRLRSRQKKQQLGGYSGCRAELRKKCWRSTRFFLLWIE